MRWAGRQRYLPAGAAPPAGTATPLPGQFQSVDQLGTDLLLPEPLAGLVQALPDRPPPGMAGRLPVGPVWLFPGRHPDRPAHPATLARRLQALGIEPRARNAALLRLAQHLPGLVMSDLLGLHPGTAARWRSAAGADWTSYSARRRSRIL